MLDTSSVHKAYGAETHLTLRGRKLSLYDHESTAFARFFRGFNWLSLFATLEHMAAQDYFFYLSALILSGVSAYIHSHALESFWYWHYPYLDIVMHALVGIVLGMSGTLVLRSWRYSLQGLGVGVLTLVCALVWEWFEYSTQTTFVTEGLLRDSVSDVGVALLSAGCVWYIMNRIYKK